MKKVFVTSLHRVGTQSTDHLLRQSGYNTIHWPAHWSDTDYQRLIVGRETDFPYVAECLIPVLDAHDAVSDVPICAIYEPLSRLYPEAVFIALQRPVEDWIRSVRRHIQQRPLDPFEHTMYWRYLAAQPKYISDIDDNDLRAMHQTHYEKMTDFFAGSERYLLAELNDVNCGEKICRFLGLPSRELPNTDYLRHMQKAQGHIASDNN